MSSLATVAANPKRAARSRSADPVAARDFRIPETVRSAVRSPGQPLEAATRAAIESHFGFDFATVRIHSDRHAAESANEIGARAYTIGRDVFFGPGEYRPNSAGGATLLRHELAHVVQQSAHDFSQGVPDDAQISSPNDTLEHEADRAAAAGVTTASKHAGPLIARQVPAAPPPAAPPPATASTTEFHPGVNHGHAPSGRWADVQANPNSGFWENRACANFSPARVAEIAKKAEFSDKPLGSQHLDWYLTNGKGADFPEDGNLDRMLRTDTGVQARISSSVPAKARSGGKYASFVRIGQQDYQDQDFRFAFGAIDRLDFEVDFTAGRIHAWFQDRYEWHPVYPFYTSLPDDVARESNCVHAAMVELKASGAQDYWMKGEATVPSSLIFSTPTRGKGSP